MSIAGAGAGRVQEEDRTGGHTGLVVDMAGIAVDAFNGGQLLRRRLPVVLLAVALDVVHEQYLGCVIGGARHGVGGQ